MNEETIGILVDIAFAVIISLLLFIFAPIITKNFIFSYIFLLIAVFMQIIPLFLCRNAQNVIYKITWFIISIIYLMFQIIISFGAIILFSNMTGKVGLISIILLFSYGIVMTVFYNISKYGQHNEMLQKEKRQLVELVIKGIRVCKNNTTDIELKEMCDEAIDRISYGNIMSIQELVNVKNQILSSVNLLEQLSAENKNNDCKEECHRLLALIQE